MKLRNKFCKITRLGMITGETITKEGFSFLNIFLGIFAGKDYKVY